MQGPQVFKLSYYLLLIPHYLLSCGPSPIFQWRPPLQLGYAGFLLFLATSVGVLAFPHCGPWTRLGTILLEFQGMFSIYVLIEVLNGYRDYQCKLGPKHQNKNNEGKDKKTSKNSVGFGVIVLPLTSKGVDSHTNCLYIFNQQAVGMCNFYYPIFSLMYDKCYYSNWEYLVKN